MSTPWLALMIAGGCIAYLAAGVLFVRLLRRRLPAGLARLIADAEGSDAMLGSLVLGWWVFLGSYLLSRTLFPLLGRLARPTR
jgi:hypothetical protein